MEGFFSISGKYSEEEILDCLLARYGQIDFIKDLEIDTFSNLIDMAFEKEERKKHYLAWCVQLPIMTDENYISFEEYLDKVMLRNVDVRPTSVIQAELDDIEKMFEE